LIGRVPSPMHEVLPGHANRDCIARVIEGMSGAPGEIRTPTPWFVERQSLAYKTLILKGSFAYVCGKFVCDSC
jgi:hypothetical protein